ncbi:hypothetical protein [Lutibacter sp.]|uniref:hypothetical protein n=1 Tax=Lutibacter sp. TaxID=1925666 RepID=UPI0035668420
MSKFPTITVKFLGNKTVIFKNVSIEDITYKLLKTDSFFNLQPMQIQFNTGKKLYFNKNNFRQFLSKAITLQELIETTETEGLYRNNETVVFKNKLDVDPGALWSKKGNQLFLIDDDWNINVKFNQQQFKEEFPLNCV